MSVNKARNDSSQKTETRNTSRNLNIQDTKGTTVGEVGGNLSIVNTDMNAIGKATDLAQRSLDVSSRANDNGIDLAWKTTRASTDLAQATNTTVADFARSSNKTVADLARNSNDNVLDIARSSSKTVADSSRDFFSKALDFVGTINARSQTTLSDTVASLNMIKTQTSMSADQRIQDTATSSVKYMVIAIGLLAGAAVLYAAMKGK